MSEPSRLEKQLRNSAKWQLALFSAALSERMFPNYGLFAELTGAGDRDQMRKILNGVWENLSGQGAKMNLEVQLDHVDANIPNLDEFDMYGAMPAYDAAVALYSTLVCAIEGDPAEAVGIANLSRECVAKFIEVTEADEEMSEEDLLRFISVHDLMVAEYDFQNDLLEQIGAARQPTPALIKTLKKLAENEGYSNIGISEAE